VSHYFNKSIYPYYEIKINGNNTEYRLSSTGYSEACCILRGMKNETSYQKVA
jgi:hypothetical protein